MTRDEKIKAYTMLLDGHTYQEVADEVGVTKQAVHKAFAGINCRQRAVFAGKRQKGKYPNLDRWIFEQKITQTQFAAMVGVASSTMNDILHGENRVNKRIIDNMLAVTGMTYEEMFKERE